MAKLPNIGNLTLTIGVMAMKKTKEPDLDVSIMVKKHLNMAGLANVLVTRID